MAMVLFAISCVLLPLSNQISGPISSDSGEVPIFSGSGSGSGGALPDNSTPFCGIPVYENSTEYSNDMMQESITRVPARVWAVIFTISAVQVVSRFDTIALHLTK